jgi:hypothetical protein
MQKQRQILALYPEIVKLVRVSSRSTSTAYSANRGVASGTTNLLYLVVLMLPKPEVSNGSNHSRANQRPHGWAGGVIMLCESTWDKSVLPEAAGHFSWSAVWTGATAGVSQ